MNCGPAKLRARFVRQLLNYSLASSRKRRVYASGLAVPQSDTLYRYPNETGSRAIQRSRKSEAGISVVQLIHRFLKDESGATAIEYGLIAAGISLAIIAAVNGMGSKLNTKFTAVNTSLK